MLSKNFKRLGSKFLATTLAVATVMPSGFAYNDSESDEKSWVQEHPVLTGAIVAGCTVGVGLIIAACRGAFSDKLEDSKTDSEQLSFVDKVLNGDVPVNARLRDMTALIIATKTGNNLKVKQLLAKGADVNVCDNDGMTPLMYAARYCSTNVVEMILNKGADPCVRAKKATIDAWTSAGMRKDHANCSRVWSMLIDKGYVMNKEISDMHGPIMFKCISDWEIDSAKLLIKAGADINYHDCAGKSILVLAVEKDMYSLVRELVETENMLKEDVEAAKKAAQGKFAIYDLLSRGKYEEENGKTYFKVKGYMDDSELEKAVERSVWENDVKALSGLLSKNESIDKNYVLMYAVENKKVEVVKFLCENYKKDIGFNDDAGMTALACIMTYCYAEDSDAEKIVDLLLANHVKIDLNNKAVYKYKGHSVTIVRYENMCSLLGYCQNVKIRQAVLKEAASRAGLTVENCFLGKNLPVLIWACKGSEKLRSDISDLLEQGFKLNIDVDDSRGHTLLDCAAEVGDKRLVAQLLEKGAKINWKNNWTLQCAAGYKGEHEDVVELLLSKHNDPSKINFNHGFYNIVVWAYQHGYNKILKKYLNESTVDEDGGHLGNSLIGNAIYDNDKNMLERLMKDYPHQVCRDYYWEYALKHASPEIYRMFPQYNDQKGLNEGLNEIFRNVHECGSLVYKANVARYKIALDVAKDLLDKGADINARDSFYKEPPLTWALQSNSPELVDFLVEHGADVMAKHGNLCGNSSNKPILECEVLSAGRYLKNLLRSKQCTKELIAEQKEKLEAKILEISEGAEFKEKWNQSKLKQFLDGKVKTDVLPVYFQKHLESYKILCK